jgi:redox-sensitive bicupin YhaK (pirin superfamily)
VKTPFVSLFEGLEGGPNMALTIREAAARGGADLGWLDTRHSFSFGDYYDPAHMGFGPLRVINEDRVAPGGGFPMHPHRDMEIVTYVLEGALAHKDTTGGASIIQPGELQRMSAGTGIRHSEFNASDKAPVHLLQIWLLPDRNGLTPGYEQKRFDLSRMKGGLLLVAAPDGRDGALTIHTAADVYATILAPGESAALSLAPGRGAWVQVARGALTVNGAALSAGDGVAVTDAEGVTLAVPAQAQANAEALVFDVAL